VFVALLIASVLGCALAGIFVVYRMLDIPARGAGSGKA